MIDVFQPLWLQSLYLLINSNSNSNKTVVLSHRYSVTLEQSVSVWGENIKTASL